MDFLEMDFDPGQSGDVDSDSVSNADIDCGKTQPAEAAKEGKSESATCLPLNSTNNNEAVTSKIFDLPKSNISSELKPVDVAKVVNENTPVKVVEPVQMPWSCMFSQRTTSISRLRTVRKHHNASGELISPTEQNTSPIVSNPPSEYQLVSDQTLNEEVKNVMIWTEQEAQTNQVTQIGASACGATAVLNVLNALRFPLPTRKKFKK